MALFTKRYHPLGTPAGTLTALPDSASVPLRLRLIDYGVDNITVVEDVDIEACANHLRLDSVTWVHVEGVPTVEMLHELGSIFQLHALALEDVLNTGQRPKLEPFDDQLFVVMSLPLMVEGLVEVQQVSFFLGKNFVLSFCAGHFAHFQPIVKRLQDPHSRVRARGADFLLYALLDIVIDQAYPVLEAFGLQLEDLEEQVLKARDSDTLEKVHTLKRELIMLRHMLWPQREVINQLLREDNALVEQSTAIYLRDCYDHIIHAMDLLETYREMTSSMLEIYLSSVNNRMSETMRVLTVIATIFIPLTFIVGVYGMNFDRTAGPWSMPELGLPYGYLLVWGVMIAIVLVMLVLFRRRGWF